jgi:hypothetical protein
MAPLPQQKFARASRCYYRVYEIRMNKSSHDIRAMSHENPQTGTKLIKETYAYARTLGHANIAQPSFLVGY